MAGEDATTHTGDEPSLTVNIRGERLYDDTPYMDHEWCEMYRPGGFHPVDLGDTLGGRYEVFAKLGCGGYSTVWLCWDQQQSTWQAIKVMAAKLSSPDCPELALMERFDLQDQLTYHITLPLGSFWVNGPNGRHLCLVLPVLGPSITTATKKSAEDQKRALFQTATGLSFLHQHGVCHGDLTSDNVLFRMPNLDHITKDQMRNLVKESETSYPCPLRKELRYMAPKKLIGPQEILIEPTNDITIVDFGVAFNASSPPSTAKAPIFYRPPEALLDIEVGFSLDIWAFACMILQVRQCQSPFSGSDPAEVVRSLEAVLGPLPEPYKTAYKRLLPEESKEEAKTEEKEEIEEAVRSDEPPETVPDLQQETATEEPLKTPTDDWPDTPLDKSLNTDTYEPLESLSFEDAEFFPDESRETVTDFGLIWQERGLSRNIRQ